jgi:hypothetical protein
VADTIKSGVRKTDSALFVVFRTVLFSFCPSKSQNWRFTYLLFFF